MHARGMCSARALRWLCKLALALDCKIPHVGPGGKTFFLSPLHDFRPHTKQTAAFITEEEKVVSAPNSHPADARLLRGVDVTVPLCR